MVSNAHVATLTALAVALLLSPVAMAADGAAQRQTTQTKPAVNKVVKTKSSAKKDVYVCPMHPEVISAKADDRCPKCGMFLEKKK